MLAVDNKKSSEKISRITELFSHTIYRTVAVIIFVLAAAVMTGCGEDMPEMPDGEGYLEVAVADTSGLFGGIESMPINFVDGAEIHLSARNHEYNMVTTTDMSGVASFYDLPTGDYSIFATSSLDLGDAKKVFTGGGDYRILGDEAVEDTVVISLIRSSDLMINEIYFCGSDASSFYFYGQFCELYNASADTMYLDGMIITRQRPVESDV